MIICSVVSLLLLMRSVQHPKSQPKLIRPPKSVRGVTSQLPSLSQSPKLPKSTRKQKANGFNSTKSLNSPKAIVKYPTLPNAPLSPSSVLSEYPELLTRQERSEIIKYKEIYYVRKYPAEKDVYQIDPEYFIFKADEHIKYQYQQVVELGRGSFGSVIKCYDHKNKRFVAVKAIRDRAKLHTQIVLEKAALDSIIQSHASQVHHTVTVYETFSARGFYFFVFELLGSDLYESLKIQKFKGFEGGTLRLISYQLSSAIQFTHSLGFVHCDIKPENVLWIGPRRNGIKLVDFGCCFQIGSPLFTYVQSRFYRAPEVILGAPYGKEVDVWSYGCVMVEMYTGRPLFGGKSEEEQIELFVGAIGFPSLRELHGSSRTREFFNSDGELIHNKGLQIKPLHKILESADHDFADMIIRCIRWHPEDRITSDELLTHPYIKRKVSFL